MIIIFVEFIDQLIDYPINCASLTNHRPLLCLKIADSSGRVAHNGDPDEMPHSVASNLGLHSLLWPVYPITYGKYSIRLRN